LSAVDFYLICFIVGFVLSLVSFMAGAMHVDFSHHGGDMLPGVHAGGDAPSLHHQGPHSASTLTVSPFNFSTLMVFLAWFGGAGALLVSQWHAGFLAALAGALVSGLIGATLVFLFLVKVLLPHDTSMKPTDYELKGTLGTLTLGIREGGTGEIAYVQGGTRKLCAARGLDAAAIAKGTEVVVLRFDQGIAYVQRWDEPHAAAKPKELEEGKPL
jgi:membrane protein implicated in regulation of membrane protease activity